MLIKSIFRVFMLLCFLFISGCVSTVFTGANIAYDRYHFYKKMNDVQLSAAVHHLLFANDKTFKCYHCSVNILVFNRDILIAGHVPNSALRDEAQRRISSISGYRRFFNQLNIENRHEYLVEDSWITTQIRSEVFLNSKIDPTSFKIMTADQVVYLLGDIFPKQASKIVQIARETQGVDKVVTLFKYYYLR